MTKNELKNIGPAIKTGFNGLREKLTWFAGHSYIYPRWVSIHNEKEKK